MKTSILAFAVTLMAGTAAAEMTAERRDSILSFYPCGASLNDQELAYLADWANALKQDPCDLKGDDFTNEFSTAPVNVDGINAVRAYFAGQNRSVLFVQQVLLFGRDDADGLWGPQTEGRFFDLLKAYHAIGGVDETWGVRQESDVPRFLAWVAAAEFALHTGGEFPD